MTTITTRQSIFDKIYSISLARHIQGECTLAGDLVKADRYGRYIEAWLRDLEQLFEQQKCERG